jgi:hypothetical protein
LGTPSLRQLDNIIRHFANQQELIFQHTVVIHREKVWHQNVVEIYPNHKIPNYLRGKIF